MGRILSPVDLQGERAGRFVAGVLWGVLWGGREGTLTPALSRGEREGRLGAALLRGGREGTLTPALSQGEREGRLGAVLLRGVREGSEDCGCGSSTLDGVGGWVGGDLFERQEGGAAGFA